MNNTSLLDLRGDQSLPALVVELLRHVAETANALNVDWFVGGATARDIVLTHVHGIQTTRATADVDIGVDVASWSGHAALKAALVAGGSFEQRGEAHRLYYRSPSNGELMWLDIVPFGGVEEGQGKTAPSEIAWPPDQAIRMNVAGFAEALTDAVAVRLAPDLVVPVASLPSQAMLKIIAWHDRHTVDRKDALDLLFLLGNYAAAGNHARLYEEHYELVEQYGHQLEFAGAALLGRDAAKIASVPTRAVIEQVLAFEQDYPRILEHMMGHRARLFEPTPDFIESAFNAFRTGFRDQA
ncbi:nucleotidyl transferase AbiEii/AbiGii toxin family protein [Paraburkholderia sediminicola]|uniref:nucleotidyl transferase AbiEii/AbiGii toxin family protein n=1 Tax=Paraburkholderia sediminicola TaxID=458836 RepID=UPI0038BC3775